MPTIRLSAFFRDDDGHGWSESHDKDGGSSITSLTTYIAAFDALMVQYRRPLLAADGYYIGCRGSYKTANGAIAGDNIERDPPMQGPQTMGGEDVFMDTAEIAVKQRMRNDASTAHSDIYLRGVWRQLADRGVLNFLSPQGAEWKRRLDQYTAALVAGAYGWLGTNPAATSRGIVNGYTRNADGTVTLLCVQTNTIPLPPAGTRVQMKFARINRSQSILNRVLTCVVDTGAVSVTTTEVIAVDPFAQDGSYIATVKGLIPYAAATYARLSSRKTGRPFGVGPGRLRAAVLH